MKLLPVRDRKILIVASLIQVLLSFLDLLGVALVGFIGALSVSGVQSKQPCSRIQGLLQWTQLSEFSFQSQVAVLAILAAIVLMSRTLLSVFFSRKTMYFLSRRGASISSDILSRLLNQNYLEVNSRSTQETIYSLTFGVSILTLTVLGGVINLVTDLSLLLVLISGLVVVDYKMALGTLLLFSSISFLLYWALNKKVHNLGESQASLSIGINERVSEVLSSYRENIVRGRRPFYAKKIASYQFDLASVQAELAFTPNISKYVIEASLVLGTLLICAIQFKAQDATHAVGVLAIFLSAGARIAPATLRIQQSALSLRNASGVARPTIELIESLENVERINLDVEQVSFEHSGFLPNIKLNEISVRYPGSSVSALTNITFDIKSGETVAIVGPSGSGKTTLADVILGVLPPSSGTVQISDLSPLDAIKNFPGAIAYVPQDVVISNYSLLENITIGFDESDVHMKMAENAISISHLNQVVQSLPLGLGSNVGERGNKLSGGQRQRLGIARALYTNPKLLVLDEATSALDGQTEADISASIQDLRGSATLILIAHRLSTVLNADRVVYLDKGEVKAMGTFSEVRSAVPDFDRQAELMGL
jgi:ABC-type multidrug transport system fused ATPase/permease subunit